MRILVTRPEAAGERTAARLAGLGHEAILLPLSIAVNTPENARQALERGPSCLAITSAETINTLAMLGESLRPFLDIPVFAVGSATAQAAREKGFAKVHSADGTAEDLAACLVSAKAAREGHVLYLAGYPRSDRLETTLRHHGIGVKTAECYQMQPIHYTDQDLQRRFGTMMPDVILLYSRETALLFFGLPSFAGTYDSLKDSAILCLSRNVAAVVPQELKPGIKIADRPNEPALFALL